MINYDIKKNGNDNIQDRLFTPDIRTKMMPLLDQLQTFGSQLEFCRKNPRFIKSFYKDDGSVVTNLDRELSLRLKHILNDLYPNEDYISEEDFQFSLSQRNISSKATWLIDPIDHTRRFVAGDPYYLTLLTRIENFQGTDAILFQPAFQAMVHVRKGLGAFVNNVQLKVSAENDINKARIAAVFCQFKGTIINGDHGLNETPEALIAVANGRVDAAIVKLCGHQIWDVAFASLLLKEAGGRLTDENGMELQYNEMTPHYNYIVASNGLIHEDVLKIISD